MDLSEADRLSILAERVTLVSPFVLLVVVGSATAATLLAHRGPRRRVLGPAWVGGVATGLLGCLVLEPPSAGDKDWAMVIVGPLLFTKWFVLGFAPTWLWCTLRCERTQRAPVAVQCFVGAAGLVLAAVTFTGTIVVERLYARDLAYWGHALDPGTTSIDLAEARLHYSSEGQARIRKVLRDRPDTVQREVLRSIHSLGIQEALSARHAPPDLITSFVDRLRRQEQLGIADRFALTALARNPVLDDASFDFICTHGNDRALEVLARNPGTTGVRRDRLIAALLGRSAQADRNPRASPVERRTWRDLARRVEAQPAEPTTPASPRPGPR